MKIIKTFAGIFFSIAGLVLLLVLAVNIAGTRADIVEGVDGNKIKQVKLGMTLEEVISLLGRPYKIGTLKGVHNADCKNLLPHSELDVSSSSDIKSVVEKFYNDSIYCCEANKEDMQRKYITLTFTRPVTFCKNYPMLWVHMDKDFKVHNVYAKCYDGILGLDDPGIYSLSWAIDTATMGMKYGTTQSYINEKLFNECFH